MPRMKYLIVDDPMVGDTPILFPDYLDHSEMACRMGLPVVAAGFVESIAEKITHDTGIGPQEEISLWVGCTGASISLQKESRPDIDRKIIEKLLHPYP
jgi:hypothetical protein